MLPVERVIAEKGLTLGRDRARIEVRLPWYRSLPLSTVRIERVAFDGDDIPLAEVCFELGDINMPLSSLEDLTNDFWFVLDAAFVTFPARIAPGSAHQVEVSITLFPPYIPGMRRTNSQSELLVAGEA